MLAGHFQWTEGVGLLSVHRKSVGKVRWTKRSNQKCSDKHQKIIGKLQWLKSRKKSILVTLSPTESARKSSGSVKTSMENLAATLSNLGKYNKARKLVIQTQAVKSAFIGATPLNADGTMANVQEAKETSIMYFDKKGVY